MISLSHTEKPDLAEIDFNLNPFIVIWEMTRSCALKCVHCRAEAIDRRSPWELTTTQAYDLLDEMDRFGKPLVVLTGGDPMRRPDALDIVEYGADLGLRMAMTPSGTNEMTFEKVRDLKKRGLARLALSLDGSTAAIHDAFRKVDGSFQWTIDIIRWANEVGMSLQINTTITKYNRQDIDALCSLMESLKISLWSVFFLVPVGRGQLQDEIKAQEYEEVFRTLYELSKSVSFDIKTTEAPHYRRFVLQQRKKDGLLQWKRGQSLTFDRIVKCQGLTPTPRAQGVNDGKGFVFISHTGEIYPSGFLPISAGNVITDLLVEIYRGSDLFRKIRDYSKLQGKCGACEFKAICGGSRARAYAVYGDYMASDPFCTHVPKGYRMSEEEKRFW